MMIVTRPEPSPRSILVPDGLPHPLDGLDAARRDAQAAMLDARDAYRAVLPDGGSEFRDALASWDGKRMQNLLAVEEPKRYSAWLLAAQTLDAATDALVAAVNPQLAASADTARLTALADLELSLLAAARSEFAEDAAGRLARAEVEIEVERLRRTYWDSFAVLAFIRSPRDWRRFNADASSPSGWPGELSAEAKRGAQVLTGAKWRMVGALSR